MSRGKSNTPSKHPNNPQQQTNNHTLVHQAYQGPIPPPAHLEQFEALIPGAAERIIKMAEQEADQRHYIEKLDADINNRAMGKAFTEQRIGQICAFLLALMAISGSIYCAAIGATAIGCVLGGSSVMAVISAFLSKNKQ